MVQYIYRDMAQAVRYLPYGLASGIPGAAIILLAVNARRKRMGQIPLKWLPCMLLGIYFAVLIAITFLSRESGSRSGVMDLKLFSTWGINDRNNAYVVENVLLFIPYGFLCSWNFMCARKLYRCVAIGAVTSFCIEWLQLVTGRGYFQIDDILTNILGTVIGWILFRIVG